MHRPGFTISPFPLDRKKQATQTIHGALNFFIYFRCEVFYMGNKRIKNIEEDITDLSNNRVKNIEEDITDLSNNRIKNIEEDITDLSNNRIKKIEDVKGWACYLLQYIYISHVNFCIENKCRRGGLRKFSIFVI